MQVAVAVGQGAVGAAIVVQLQVLLLLLLFSVASPRNLCRLRGIHLTCAAHTNTHTHKHKREMGKKRAVNNSLLFSSSSTPFS